MKIQLILGLVLLSLCICLIQSEEVHAEAGFLNCGTINSWVAGRTNGFGSPHAPTYSPTNAAQCVLTINPPGSTYTPGQTFTITVKGSQSFGYKVETTNGEFSGPSAGGRVNTAKCVDYDKARQQGTMTFTAPNTGIVQIKALCAPSAGSVFVSAPIFLTPPAASKAPTPPTTAAPTVEGETRSPTLSPIAIGELPPGVSEDPEFQFKQTLGATVNMHYKLNETHARVKLELTIHTGYLSVGPGTQMVGSTVIVGMDPVVNAPASPVGLYKLVNEIGSKNSDIMTDVAVNSAQLEAAGISEASFANVDGLSVLKFSLELAKQSPDFTLVNADGSSLNIVYAAGPQNADGAYCKNNVCFEHEDFNIVPGVNLAFAPGEAGAAAGIAIPLSTELMVHIVTMLIGWGILIPIGVIIPLYNNIKYSTTGTAFCGVSGPMWLKYHWVLISIGLLFTYVGSITGFQEVKGEHFEAGHPALGLLLLVVSIFQPLLAFIRPDRKTTTVSQSILRKSFDYTHLPVGYFFLVLAIIENLIGVQLLNENFAGLPYDFAGSTGDTGFGGPMGVITLILSIAAITALAIGLFRATLTKCRKGEDATAYQNMGQQGPAGGGGDVRKPKRTVRLDELALHNTAESCWMAYKGKVYDVTAFLGSHPGGKKVMMPYAGKDMTKGYDETGHSPEANAMLPRYFIGDLSSGRGSRGRSISQRISSSFNQMKQYMAMPDGFSSQRLSMAMSRFSSIPENWGGNKNSSMKGAMVASGSDDGNSTKFLAGSNQQRRRVVLSERYQISHNVYYLKFAFPSPQMVLGLPTGKHIAIYAPNIPGKSRGNWNNQPDPEAGKKEIQRKFTPVSSDEMDVGYFALVVKVYRPSPQFPDGGKISRYLETLRVGSSVEIAGPFGSHQYVGKGRFNDSGNELLFTEVAMVAGGSGITPPLQIASAMLRDPNDRTRIALLYSNTSTDDILMKDHLNELQRRYPNRFRVWYTVSQDPMQSGKHYSFSQPWTWSIGRINKQMMREHLPSGTRNSIAVVCGPKPMMESTNKLLQELGYTEDRIVEY